MLKFQNKKFKIMQIADIQESAKVNPDTVKLIELCLEKESPDLVVFTGDQIMGYSPSYKKNSLEAVQLCIKTFIEPLKNRGIPFCVTFGNHDRECHVSHEEQMKIYASYDNFVYGEPNGDDIGTYSLQIKSSDESENVFNLYIFDSNAKEKDGTYSPIFPEQIQWYKNEREKIFAENAKYLPSIVFQHIPCPEFFDIIKRVDKGTKGCVEAFNSHANEFYVLHEDCLSKGDFMYEAPAVSPINNGQFEALKEKGEVMALFVGHDHINSFVKNLDGIDLGYTQGAGFNVYGPGAKRGVRIFELDENDLSTYQTRTVTMQDVCNYRPAKPVKEFIMTSLPTSLVEAKRLAIRSALIVGGTSITLGLAYKFFKK